MQSKKIEHFWLGVLGALAYLIFITPFILFFLPTKVFNSQVSFWSLIRDHLCP